MTDLREIGPTYYFAPPRVLENLITQVTIRMEDAGFAQAPACSSTSWRWPAGSGRRCSTAGRSSPIDRLLYALGNLLIYGPLKNTLGMSRVRVAYTAGEAVGPEIFNFYRALGVNMKQLYGQTEASVFVTIHPNGEVFPDTVGKPVAEVELRIAESGEVLYRSPGVFKEYFKNPQATNDTKTADGWVHTGDAGYLDERGHLRIIDRAKDVGKLNDGTLFAPKFIENKLKFFPHINEAVAFGHGRDFVAVFVNIDMIGGRRLGRAAQHLLCELPGAGGAPRRSTTCAGEIERVNRDLAADPRMAGAQIRRFLILHKALEADDGELTRTNKVRRGFIGERYKALVDALYDGSKSVHIKVDVTFEDGRKGTIEGDVEIRDLAPHPDRRRRWRCGRRAERNGRPRAFLQRGAAVGREHQPVVRRREGADRHQLRHRQGRDPRHHRPQRRRQVVDAELHQRLLSPAAGRHHLQGRARAARCGRTRRPSRASPAPSRTSRCSRACRRSTTS